MKLLVEQNKLTQVKLEASKYLTHTLTDRQLCDIELILNGGFSPLTGFLNKSDYQCVLDSLRLSDGSVWPIPITLDVNKKLADSISIGDNLSLKDKEGFLIAILNLESKWSPDKSEEAKKIFGTTDEKHPGVNFLLNKSNNWYLGGSLKGVVLPKHYDFLNLRQTPNKIKANFTDLGWEKIVAFQTRNPMHRAHVEITKLAAQDVGGNLLIHPVVGMTKPGDVDHLPVLDVIKSLSKNIHLTVLC